MKPTPLVCCSLLLAWSVGCGSKPVDSSSSADDHSATTTDLGDTDDGPGQIPVYVGDVELRSDDEVVLLEGYETIQGSVALLDGVTDLSPLSSLTEITGSLRIEDTTTLPSLTGLEQLTTIGGDLGIRGSTLTSFSGLDSLASVEGLSIEGTENFSDLSALAGVTTLSRNLVVTDTTLPSLAGLEGLTQVRGYLNIQQASQLTSLAGLQNLATVGKTVFLVANPVLSDPGGLTSLTSVGESLAITDLPALTAVDLPVQQVVQSVQIVRNPQLTSIRLAGLQAAGEVELHGNAVLTDVELPALVEVEGWLQVDDNDSLTTLGDFSALTTVDERVSITRNEALSSIASSLPALVEVGENFDAHDNPVLAACDVAAVVDRLEDLGGSVVNTGNDDDATCE